MNIRDAIISDSNLIAKVHVDSRRITYKGIESDEALESLSYEEKEQSWKRRLVVKESKEIILVAEIDGKVIGFASGTVHKANDEFRGEISTIYLLLEFGRLKKVR